ncbi:MAG: toxin-antitoxin system HicB family antitoxin [Anaerolineae bacterium CG_4_9_14_3_um_filter_57_17]|nr:toxin-antitoxin system HicB family antitoxin [bacterium]NCT21381.1 toxin-antitoxin system HicB family antitoxin [bacterium]OIO83728.1 MAG: hypothetical protein AUK01_11980 [Anaerolineae bacterium CG2_30_57_67]PJB66783.1 MAG: toxin-antitoxin system HicB family antitoxin [Anaerolineae bacterium CG_4_9_14_3_um_filter_57_17]
MSRLTLRLPDSLHQQLEQMAESEKISLNQYIVYALTRQLTMTYTVQAVPEKVIAEERAAYSALLQALGRASLAETKEALSAPKISSGSAPARIASPRLKNPAQCADFQMEVSQDSPYAAV